jgi:hypothetical protein
VSWFRSENYDWIVPVKNSSRTESYRFLHLVNKATTVQFDLGGRIEFQSRAIPICSFLKHVWRAANKINVSNPNLHTKLEQ